MYVHKSVLHIMSHIVYVYIIYLYLDCANEYFINNDMVSCHSAQLANASLCMPTSNMSLCIQNCIYLNVLLSC
jgi:hypothetical protein